MKLKEIADHLLLEADLGRSFASLVKYNNGFFKSEKQARYLLSQCENGTYTTSGSVYGNPYHLDYHCDDKGVTKVTKYTPNTGKWVTNWTRKVKGEESVGETESIRVLKRELKRAEKDLEGIKAEKSSFATPDQYERALDRAEFGVLNLKNRLKQVTSGIGKEWGEAPEEDPEFLKKQSEYEQRTKSREYEHYRKDAEDKLAKAKKKLEDFDETMKKDMPERLREILADDRPRYVAEVEKWEKQLKKLEDKYK